MRIGLDIDGTITKAPEFYSIITRALLLTGNEVHIISYRETNLIEYTYAQLRKWKIQYTRLHMTSEDISAPEWKARIATKMGLDMMIDDDIANLMAMPKEVKRLCAL